MLTSSWIKQLPLTAITQVTPVGGGDVNQAYRIDTATKPYFLLVQPGYPADFYAGEIAGLKAFDEAQILAPRVIANGQIEGDGFLLLSFLTSGNGSQRDLGRLVAHLHQHHEPNGRFGFDYPYAGTSVSFTNTWTDSWADLFIHQRLDKLAAHLLKRGCGKPTMKQPSNRCAPSSAKHSPIITAMLPCCTVTYGVGTTCLLPMVSQL